MISGDENRPVGISITVELETSPGNAHPLLQHFPTPLLPRVGDKLSFAGLQGDFAVVEVRHLFYVSPQQRHIVIVTVRQLEEASVYEKHGIRAV